MAIIWRHDAHFVRMIKYICEDLLQELVSVNSSRFFRNFNFQRLLHLRLYTCFRFHFTSRVSYSAFQFSHVVMFLAPVALCWKKRCLLSSRLLLLLPQLLLIQISRSQKITLFICQQTSSHRRISRLTHEKRHSLL